MLFQERLRSASLKRALRWMTGELRKEECSHDQLQEEHILGRTVSDEFWYFRNRNRS